MTIEEVFEKNAACVKAQRACAVLGKSLAVADLDIDISSTFVKVSSAAEASREVAVNACLKEFSLPALVMGEALAFYRLIGRIS